MGIGILGMGVSSCGCNKDEERLNELQKDLKNLHSTLKESFKDLNGATHFEMLITMLGFIGIKFDIVQGDEKHAWVEITDASCFAFRFNVDGSFDGIEDA